MFHTWQKQLPSIIQQFLETYRRHLQKYVSYLVADVRRAWWIQQWYHDKGFPGCVGTIDFSKLFWEICTVKDKGQYLNTKELTKLTYIQCEAWCDADLYCWHWNVGGQTTKNDIYLLTGSRLFNKILYRLFPFRVQDVYKFVQDGQ